MTITFMLKDLNQVVEKILDNTANKTILFYGEMGVGKTTLIKELAKKIGVIDMLGSPTYSIVNEYELDDDKLFHFDCYRLKSLEEALDIGIEDYLDSGHWNLIEWPNLIEHLVPDENIKIEIVKNNNGSRTINFMPVN